jgi:hypothetical protein
MHARSLSGKRGRSRDLGTDRAIAGAVMLAITTVLLLIAFAGPSVYLTLPGPAGWLYIGIVIIAASVALVWLFRVDGKRKRRNPTGLRTLNRWAKRTPLQKVATPHLCGALSYLSWTSARIRRSYRNYCNPS